MNKLAEEWRVIPDFGEKYSVSSLGRFRNNETGKMKATTISKRTGYALVNLSKKSKAKTYRSHSIVLTVFKGERPENSITRHLNGVRHDNRVSNLCWGTHKENHADAMLHQTSYSYYRGKFFDKHPNGKLSEDDINDIIIKLESRTQKDVATDYGVCASTISIAVKNANARKRTSEKNASCLRARAEMKLTR